MRSEHKQCNWFLRGAERVGGVKHMVVPRLPVRALRGFHIRLHGAVPVTHVRVQPQFPQVGNLQVSEVLPRSYDLLSGHDRCGEVSRTQGPNLGKVSVGLVEFLLFVLEWCLLGQIVCVIELVEGR